MSAAKIIRFPDLRPKDQQDADLTPEELVDDYLEHLCAPLVGWVPYRERERLREEARSHLEGRAHAYGIDGFAPQEAMRRSIERFGKSARLSEEFLETWLNYQSQGKIVQKLGLNNAYALFFFGQMAALSYLFLNLRLVFPPSSSLRFGESVHRFDAIGMPLPDGSIWTYLFLGIVFLAPFVAGWLTGRMAVLHAARAVYHMMLPIIIGTFFLGVALLPSREGLFVALAETLWWLPVGCLTAHVAAAVTWRRRCAYHSIPIRRNL